MRKVSLTADQCLWLDNLSAKVASNKTGFKIAMGYFTNREQEINKEYDEFWALMHKYFGTTDATHILKMTKVNGEGVVVAEVKPEKKDEGKKE